MKNRKRWYFGTAIAIALVVAFSAPVARPSAQAQFGTPRGQECCDRLSGGGQGIATAADTFVVDAEFTLSGGPLGGIFGAQFLPIKATTKLLTQSPPDANGTINAITSHVFEIKGQSNENGVCEPGENCMVTLDRAALIPTATPGLMNLHSVVAISDGQGRFAKVAGKIDAVDGQINFAAAPPTVHWTFSGARLCPSN